MFGRRTVAFASRGLLWGRACWSCWMISLTFIGKREESLPFTAESKGDLLLVLGAIIA